MTLSGVHLLLTYQCNYECEHCFVFGSPWQKGTMTLAVIDEALKQSKETGTVTSIYFEGGEPFLYYVTLLEGAGRAAALGFSVGIVTNAYWATSRDDALAALRPFAGLIDELSISSDLYHWSEELGHVTRHAWEAARELGIPVGTISIAEPEASSATMPTGQLPDGESGVMFRGRAAVALSSRARKRSWHEFSECPHEDLREPGRIHLDPLGNVHICQGISAGNIFESSLSRICAEYDPDGHAITGPILAGGPAELVRRAGLPHDVSYADACHLCFEARRALRGRFPRELGPDQMYGDA